MVEFNRKTRMSVACVKLDFETPDTMANFISCYWYLQHERKHEFFLKDCSFLRDRLCSLRGLTCCD